MGTRQLKDARVLEQMEFLQPYLLLANSVVLQAIDDWKRLCKGAYAGVSFGELRAFFKGEYCELLLHGTSLTGEYILNELEDLREAVKCGMSIATWEKRRFIRHG